MTGYEHRWYCAQRDSENLVRAAAGLPRSSKIRAVNPVGCSLSERAEFKDKAVAGSRYTGIFGECALKRTYRNREC